MSFQVISKNKTWHLEDPKIKMGRQSIPYADPEKVIQYLGATVSPWQGLRKFSEQVILDSIKAIKKMKLKPYQKVNLIRTYFLPRFIHQLVANPPSLGLLDQIDHEIKGEIKNILHLHPSTTDGLTYTDKSHGGLGVQRVANNVKITKHKNAIKMMASDDIIVRNAFKRQEGHIKKYASSIGLQWPSNMEQIETIRKSLKRKDTDKWKNLISQGQEVSEFFSDKIGNAWLYHPELLKPSRYLDALKLRTNTFGTKVALNRAKKNLDVRCRRCGVQAETLGHILGNCIQTKSLRIKRHNEICKLIVQNMPQHWAVFEEPAVNVVGELKKPDLVIKDQEKVYVVDVTVRYEDKDNLQKPYKQKIHKYQDTAEIIRIKTMGTEAEIIPIVIGCRGAMPKNTINNLKRLGLKKKDMLTASLIALRSSIEIEIQDLAPPQQKPQGLGIPSLRWTAPLHRMGRLTTLKESDSQFRNAEMDKYIDNEISKCTRRLTAEHPMLDADDVRKRWADRLYLSVDGQGLRESHRTPQQHRWIGEGTRLLRGRDFFNCINARIRVLPTRSRTSRGRYADRQCRAGCIEPETFNHVVQHCHRTHGLRIKRHDAIVAYIARNLSRQGYRVTREPSYTTDEGIRKPDLVATMGKTTIVVDAQVKREGSEDLRTHSATISWRGVWSPASAEELLQIGVIRSSELKILFTRALIGTIAAFNLFSRTTTVRRVGIG
ncbi:Retrovirus-related Pol polyprotein from type-2 retrotransposable element R2DM [Anthophora plagiata]